MRDPVPLRSEFPAKNPVSPACSARWRGATEPQELQAPHVRCDDNSNTDFGSGLREAVLAKAGTPL